MFFFILSFLLLVIHQITQKLLHIPIPWADNYLDCLLCMPFLLGGLLYERQFLFGRGKKYRLANTEIILAVVVFSIIFEGLFPMYSKGFTRDIWDVGCYAIGGWMFYQFINPKKD